MNRLYRYLVVTCTLAAIGIAFAACVSFRREPAWLTDFPNLPGYYVGIGSSNTGDPGQDMETARTRALANLAASISTRIQSEQRFVSREDSGGSSYSTAEVVISETVSEHLREVETADTFYSRSVGYWFYLRLNRSIWEMIQIEEAKALADRVGGIVSEAYEGASAAARLTLLAKAWQLLAASPYAGFAEAELFGTRGVLLDIVEAEMQRRVEELSIEFDPPLLVAEAGRPTPLAVRVYSESAARAGEFTIRIESLNGVVLQTLITDDHGLYSGVLDTKTFNLGKSVLNASLDLRRHGIDISGIPLRVSTPERQLQIDVRQISAGFVVVVPEEVTLSNVPEAIASIITDSAPFKIGQPGPDDRFVVEVLVSMRKVPESEYTKGMEFVFMHADFSVLSEGKILFSYRSGEVKEGGLSVAQAQDRAFAALLEALRSDVDLARHFAEILSYE